MLPSELQPANFAAYPREAKALALEQIELFRRLPLSFLPLLLREAQEYDWKFPAERREITDQLAYLRAQSPEQIRAIMQPFESLQLSTDLAQFDWVNDPVQFSEKLSAFLWSTHQMDPFRKASIEYVRNLHAAKRPAQLPTPRLAIVVIGEGVRQNSYPLFRKLRSRGAYLKNVQPAGGVPAILRGLEQRAADHPEPFAHWYVDGAAGQDLTSRGIACVDYRNLQRTRVALVSKMIATMKPGGGGPEALRTDLAKLKPADVGLPETQGSQAIMSRFQLSLLTQGSGTQIFSTTFVQWSAREILRRAQPLTLVARYAPRQKDAAVRELKEADPPSDPAASLIDGDMGAYYTWLNQQRLPSADQARFLVWFEGHGEAVACGPAWKPGSEDSRPLTINQLLSQLA